MSVRNVWNKMPLALSTRRGLKNWSRHAYRFCLELYQMIKLLWIYLLHLQYTSALQCYKLAGPGRNLPNFAQSGIIPRPEIVQVGIRGLDYSYRGRRNCYRCIVELLNAPYRNTDRLSSAEEVYAYLVFDLPTGFTFSQLACIKWLTAFWIQIPVHFSLQIGLQSIAFRRRLSLLRE
jgi:hypothetical protein